MNSHRLQAFAETLRGTDELQVSLTPSLTLRSALAAFTAVSAANREAGATGPGNAETRRQRLVQPLPRRFIGVAPLTGIHPLPRFPASTPKVPIFDPLKVLSHPIRPIERTEEPARWRQRIAWAIPWQSDHPYTGTTENRLIHEGVCALILLSLWRLEGELELGAVPHGSQGVFRLDRIAVQGEGVVTLGPGEEREVERIPEPLRRFLLR